MNTVKQLAQVGEDGLLKIELPVGLKNVQVEYVIVYHTQPQDMTQQERLHILNHLHGSLAETPLEEVAQLPLEEREEIE